MSDERHRFYFPPFRYFGAERLSRAIGAVEEGQASSSDRRVLKIAVVALAVPVVVAAGALLVQTLG